MAFIEETPIHQQEAIKQAILKDTYVEDGGVGADSQEESVELQAEISSILADQASLSWQTRHNYPGRPDIFILADQT